MAKVTYMTDTCSRVPGIAIRCDGYEGLRRLGQLMAKLEERTVQTLDLLAELPAEGDGVESCMMELVLDAACEPTRSVFVDLQQTGAARVRWRNSPLGWSECMEALRILVSGSDPRLIQTFGTLRDDVAVVEVWQE